MRAIKWVFVLAAVMAIAANYAGDEGQTLMENQEREAVVKGNNKFALELYGKLRDREGNLFFSPYSISTALAMTYAGAKGETESQMAKVLHFPTRQDGPKVAPPEPNEKIAAPAAWGHKRFSSAFGRIIKDLNTRGKKGKYELRVANALWDQKGYGFLKEFLNLIEADYGGCLNEVDFVTAVELARKTINDWVENQTNNKIKNLIPEGVLDSMTRLVLTNAIYFKGNWARQFKKEKTQNAPFTLLNGNKVDVPMMSQTADFNYIQTDSFQGLELPYVNDELSMIILLPKKLDGLPELEGTVTINNLSKWLNELRKREVIVFVPKFTMTSQFGLADVLKAMGMTNAFVPDVADFSGINGKRDLFISAVIHKAYVDINEEGTEAAAATAVVMKLTSVGPTQTPVFRVDHPFLFVIRDNRSGSILFIGRVINPE
ncbi:MAG: serpin family protein [Planctomycetota bacterium]|nr:serpin family protein [Planctomycetota bacterium]